MHTEKVFKCDSEQALIDFGKRLGKACNGSAIIYLEGELGAGKTTLCRGFLAAFGYEGVVKSPTYTLVEPYQIKTNNTQTIYHFDLYRLGDAEELDYIGIRDYFHDQSICLIEWPQKGKGAIAAADLSLSINICTDFSRDITVLSHSDQGAAIISQLE